MALVSTAYSAGSDRNNFTGYVGMKFVATAITVNRLGVRKATGNTGSYTVSLCNAAGSVLTSASITLTNGVVGNFYYASCSPVTLVNGTTYYVVLAVTNSGSNWADQGSITLSPFISAAQAVYASTLGTWTDQSANQCYAGLNFDVTYALPTKVFLTSGTTWTVPSDWNSAANIVEAIGGGGGGGTTANGNGGGGGAYAVAFNFSASPGASISYAIGAGGAGGGPNDGGDTTFNSTTVVAKGGKGGPTFGTTGGAGGAGASCTPSTGAFSGGACGNGGNGAGGGGGAGPLGPGHLSNAQNGFLGGSGGGNGGGFDATASAGGASNDGTAGGSATSGAGNNPGGNGSNGSGGGGGNRVANGGNGGNGVEWDSTHGSGGGAGGASTGNAGTAGLYGGGGGSELVGTSSAGAQGIIVITYTAVSSGANIFGRASLDGLSTFGPKQFSRVQ